ncbi:MAG: formylglycine-generating enzyme family protein [Nitrospinota bacterium]
MRRKIFLTLFPALFFAGPHPANAEIDKACGKSCHENPQFTRADKTKLTECKVCHFPSAHKKNTQKIPFRLVPNVEAAEKESSRNCAEADCTKTKKSSKNMGGMVLIPEGEFIMGSDDRLKDEKPAHVVFGKPFYIDMYEVTNGKYKNFLSETGYSPPENWTGKEYPKGKKEHPVTYVSWYDADNYCKWAGKRLPREWEWEKAARGTDGRVYPWGNVWDMYKSNNPLRALEDTQPVGSYEEGKSPYGLYDMSGNVWEWVDDHYFPHPGSDYINPEFGVKYRLLKGGSYWDCSFYSCGISAPVYNRAFFEPEVKGESYGFRCASDAE